MQIRRIVLAVAVVIALVGGVAATLWESDGTSDDPVALGEVTTTTVRTKVLAVVVANTTTTLTAPNSAADPEPAEPTTTTIVAAAARSGRIWGYSFATAGDDDKTTVTLSRDGKPVAERVTDADGLFDFRDLPAGLYALTRTSRSSSCGTTTTAGERPPCATASSRSDGPAVQLEPGQDYRVDVF